MGVEGFAPNKKIINGHQQKMWGEISSDIGAAYFGALDDNRATSPYGNLRFRQPLGHEYFNTNHIMMKLLWELGFDVLAKFYGFTSPNQISFFMLGTLSHKTFDFVCICREVMTDLMIKEWIRNGGDILDSDPEMKFHEWMNDNDATSDKHFSNIVWLLEEVFPAYSTYTKGIRNNMQVCYKI